MSTNIMSLPEASVVVRPAVMGDLSFIDSLQKMHTKMVGWMPTKQLEGKIASGHLLVAEEVGGRQECRVGTAHQLDDAVGSAHPTVGYCIGHDQYFKRDDVGIIYQMNVMPGRQRGLIGATLLKAQFEKSAWGCKLYCCWCAQDIGANRFWEAMGFVPLAFRTGSAKRGAKGGARTHIFWQRRIRQGDTTTPWWFPSQTSAGSIREDRLVLPIRPGVHWSDAMPRVLPSEEVGGRQKAVGGKEGTVGGEESLLLPPPTACRVPHTARKLKAAVPRMPTLSAAAFSWETPKTEPVKKEKKAAAPRVRQKNDPALVAAARELRDRWLEEVNAGRYLPGGAGKYEVGRELLPEDVGEAGRLRAAKRKRIAA